MISFVALAVSVFCGTARGQQAYVGGPGLEWRAIACNQQGGRLTVRISPEDTDSGRCILVLHKPGWMVLDDVQAPALKSLRVNDSPVDIVEPLRIQTQRAGPKLEAILEDDTNPLDRDSISLHIEGRNVPLARLRAKTLARAVAASFDLSGLGPGVHEGILQATDLSPLGNNLRLPIRIEVDGLLRHADGQTVTICRAGREYVIGSESMGRAFVRLGNTGAAAYLSTEINGKFVYARKIKRIADLPDGNGVRMTTDVIGIEDQDFGQIAELEFDIATDPDISGILITSRARNLDADGPVYCFWGWLPGSSFVTRDGEQTWSMEYKPIGKVGWVYLRPSAGRGPGIGVVSDLPFGESRFGTLLLYTDPKRIETLRSKVVEMKLALMLADSPEPVAEAYRTLKARGWLQGK